MLAVYRWPCFAKKKKIASARQALRYHCLKCYLIAAGPGLPRLACTRLFPSTKKFPLQSLPWHSVLCTQSFNITLRALKSETFQNLIKHHKVLRASWCFIIPRNRVSRSFLWRRKMCSGVRSFRRPALANRSQRRNRQRGRYWETHHISCSQLSFNWYPFVNVGVAESLFLVSTSHHMDAHNDGTWSWLRRNHHCYKLAW